MRGDTDDFIDESIYLVESADLKGVPVVPTTGRRLGTLDGVVVSRHKGSIGYLVVSCRRLFGLLRDRFVLPRSALKEVSPSGGFVVHWDDRADEPKTSPPALPLPLQNVPVRLDPSRPE